MNNYCESPDINLTSERVRTMLKKIPEVIKIHVDKNLVVAGDHIDPKKWNPLIYNFRHYYGVGKELGKTFKSEV